ncbi:hypothetical protein M0804_013361 [Polistes exclamans]|nr:hypothetical protein M0804_013361 [Polistes exclamans]
MALVMMPHLQRVVRSSAIPSFRNGVEFYSHVSAQIVQLKYETNFLVKTLSKCRINTALIVVPCRFVETAWSLFIKRFESSCWGYGPKIIRILKFKTEMKMYTDTSQKAARDYSLIGIIVKNNFCIM